MNERRWTAELIYDNPMRRSELCKAMHVHADWYKRWCSELKEAPKFHRKQWEFVYILQSLWERGCIAPGKKGLVFAVGSEPLPSIMANHGVNITATDIFPEEGAAKGWTNGDQLCFGIESLNKRGLCTDEVLRRQVSYRPVDMNDIPSDLKGYDFTWSSCSFEHLGSIELGIEFLKNQMKTLKPGGWAVHTTEFNISSNDKTLTSGDTVIYRIRDIERVVYELRKQGYFVEEVDLSFGGLEEDFAVDRSPHRQDIHLKLQLNEFIVTSIGLIIGKRPGSEIYNKIRYGFRPKWKPSK